MTPTASPVLLTGFPGEPDGGFALTALPVPPVHAGPGVAVQELSLPELPLWPLVLPRSRGNAA